MLSFPFHPRFTKLLLLPILAAFAVGLLCVDRAQAQTASQEYAQGVDAYHRGDVEGAKQKLQLALTVDPNFRPATALLARIAAEKNQPAAVGFNAKTLERTTLSAEFNNTTLTTAIEYVRAKVAEDSGNKLVLNFAVNLPPELANKKITLTMTGVPVLELLRYMGEQAGVKFEKQQYAIIVKPAGDKTAGTSASPTPAIAPGS